MTTRLGRGPGGSFPPFSAVEASADAHVCSGAEKLTLEHEGPFGPQLGLTPYNDVRFGLLGGSIVDANALLRAYIWHCIGIPLVASIFMAVHFWRIRKDGGISGPAPVMLESEMKTPKKK